MARKFKPGVIPCRTIRRCEHVHRERGGRHWRIYCDLRPDLALVQIKECPLEEMKKGIKVGEQNE